MVIAVIQFINPYIPQILAFFLTLSGSLIVHFFRPKVNLIYGERAFFVQKIITDKEKNLSVYLRSRSITIANTGRAPAEDVKIILNYEPDAFSVWPQRPYIIDTNPELKYIITFDVIGPKENFFIDITCVDKDIPLFLGIRNKYGEGKLREFISQRAYHKSVGIIFLMLCGIGFVAILSQIIKIFL